MLIARFSADPGCCTVPAPELSERYAGPETPAERHQLVQRRLARTVLETHPHDEAHKILASAMVASSVQAAPHQLPGSTHAA